ncbi:hypothetical protein D3C87_1914750 [compost metagenome]
MVTFFILQSCGNIQRLQYRFKCEMNPQRQLPCSFQLFKDRKQTAVPVKADIFYRSNPPLGKHPGEVQKFLSD